MNRINMTVELGGSCSYVHASMNSLGDWAIQFPSTPSFNIFFTIEVRKNAALEQQKRTDVIELGRRFHQKRNFCEIERLLAGDPTKSNANLSFCAHVDFMLLEVKFLLFLGGIYVVFKSFLSQALLTCLSIHSFKHPPLYTFF